ncbi:hypothetical protein CRUP_013917 [Coryphaenoides rupestris]|nr:hypothetical protein CRUP_013917 [Coryphaenoides rupestris]
MCRGGYQGTTTRQAGQIYTCHWLGESHMLVGGSEANTLAVINRNSLQREGRLGGLGSPVFSSSVCVGGKRSGLIAGASGSSVYILDHHK